MKNFKYLLLSTGFLVLQFYSMGQSFADIRREAFLHSTDIELMMNKAHTHALALKRKMDDHTLRSLKRIHKLEKQFVKKLKISDPLNHSFFLESFDLLKEKYKPRGSDTNSVSTP